MNVIRSRLARDLSQARDNQDAVAFLVSMCDVLIDIAETLAVCGAYVNRPAGTCSGFFFWEGGGLRCLFGAPWCFWLCHRDQVSATFRTLHFVVLIPFVHLAQIRLPSGPRRLLLGM